MWNGVPKTMSYWTLANGYVVFAVSDVSESLSAVGAMRRAVYIGIIAVLVVASIVIVLFSRSLARPLRAGSDQNDDAAAAHGMAGVGECLLCLVKIHILGRAAL